MPLAPGSGETRRPYFETLFVTPAPAANFPQIAQELRRLRRVEDPMIYEPVLVGSFEDAIDRHHHERQDRSRGDL